MGGDKNETVDHCGYTPREAAVARAEDPSDMTFERLAKVHRFAFGGTAYTGSFPKEKMTTGLFCSAHPRWRALKDSCQ